MKANKSVIIAVVSLAVIFIGVALVLIVRDNKTTTSNSNLSASQLTSDKTDITSNWESFFNAKTANAVRVSLLQNGPNYLSAIKNEFQSLGAANSSAKVSSISFTSPTNASVIYTVTLNGSPVLVNQKGTSVYVNKTWLVSDSTLCGLLNLAGSKPAACQNV